MPLLELEASIHMRLSKKQAFSNEIAEKVAGNLREILGQFWGSGGLGVGGRLGQMMEPDRKPWRLKSLKYQIFLLSNHGFVPAQPIL